MKHKKAIATCALVALGVGATSATASSLITSANIKDGTIHMRDLAPTLQKKITRAGKPGPQGANGANGATGLNGDSGAKGQDGTNGVNGANGTNGVNGAPGDPGAQGAPGAQGSQGIPGQDGKDGVRYDRIVGSCDGGKPGEISIARRLRHLRRADPERLRPDPQLPEGPQGVRAREAVLQGQRLR